MCRVRVGAVIGSNCSKMFPFGGGQNPVWSVSRWLS